MTTGPLANPPGRSSLAYRLGTHGSFKAAMKRRLSEHAALRGLTTRDDDDPAVALLDAWAVVLDVLAFYQERIADEAYLGTATERRSILELARSIGYELGPGVAASVPLAFTVDDAEQAPRKVTVPAGARVQSLPDESGFPRTFETIAPIEARVAWNGIVPRQVEPQPVEEHLKRLYLRGTSTRLDPGDALLFVGPERQGDPTSEKWSMRLVKKVTPEPAADRTLVEWRNGLAPLGPIGEHEEVRVHALRRRASIYGFNAPDWRSLPDATKAGYIGIEPPDVLKPEDRLEWPDFNVFAPEYPGAEETSVSVIEPTAESVARAVIAAAEARSSAAMMDLVQTFAEAVMSAVKAAYAMAIAGATAASGFYTAIGSLVEALRTLWNTIIPSFPSLAVSGVGPQMKEFVDALTLGLLPDEDADRAVDSLQEMFDDLLEQFGFSDIPDGTTPLEGIEAAISKLRESNPLLAPLDALRQHADPTGALTLASAVDKVVQHVGSTVDAVTSIPGKLATVAVEMAMAKAVSQAVNTALDVPPGVPRTKETVALSALVVTNLFRGAAQVLITPGEAIDFLEGLPNLTALNLDTVVDNVQSELDDLEGEGELGYESLNALAGATALGVLGTVSIGAASTAGAGVFVGGVAAAVLVYLQSWLLFAAVPLVVVSAPLLLAATAVIYVITAAVFKERIVDSATAIEEAVRAALEPPLDAMPMRRHRKRLDDTIDLEAVHPRVAPGGYVVLSTPAQEELYDVTKVTEASRSDYLLTGKTTRITLEGKNLRIEPEEGAEEPPPLESVFDVRTTTVFAESEELEIAELPIEAPVAGGGVALAESESPLVAGRPIAVTGVDAGSGEPRSEVVTVDEVDGANLVFREELRHAYERTTCRLCANVAPATHGETRFDVLGSGDPTRPFPRFDLRQRPLTFVPAPTPSGAASTLEVRVDDLPWREVRSLFGAAPNDRVFTARRADDGTVTVRFGDGRHGARPPAGVENVRAVYRIGTGPEGVVRTGQIRTLLSVPPGIRGVTNPEGSKGAGRPERLEDARENAPVTVRTLDRVVSLHDFEDFARTFAGVAKAKAEWVGDRGRPRVHLTVASEPTGGGVDLDRLRHAIRAAAPPFQPFELGLYEEREFRVRARLVIAAGATEEGVLAAAREAMTSAFSFEARRLAEGLAKSAVIARLQRIDGVVAVDLDAFDVFDPAAPDDPPGLETYLPARGAGVGAGVTRAAELLTLRFDEKTLEVLS